MASGAQVEGLVSPAGASLIADCHESAWIDADVVDGDSHSSERG
jgi:hypothetical protein